MTVDFDELRGALARAADKVSGRLDRKAVNALLKARSRQMAGRVMEQAELERFGHVIVVRRGTTHLGVPIDSAQEVRSVEVAVLPRATEVVLGLFQVRGQVHSLIDVGPFFDVASPLDHGERALVVLVAGTPGVVGMRIDEVLGPRELYVEEIDRELHGGRIDFVSHVTTDLLQVVDVNAMLSMPALRLGVR
jgi:chemotaxis signal transduction protein